MKTDAERELAHPRFLSRLCNQIPIRMLGRAYLKLKPDENGNEVLVKDLLPETKGRVFLKTEDLSLAESQIEKRIKRDFDTDKHSNWCRMGIVDYGKPGSARSIQSLFLTHA